MPSLTGTFGRQPADALRASAGFGLRGWWHNSLFTLLLTVGGVGSASATQPLDEALRLAIQADAQVAARIAELRAIEDQPRWSSDLSLSLSRGESEFGASDTGRAMLSVKIPLVGTGRKREQAAARHALAAQEAGVREAFLAAVQELQTAALEVEAAKELRELYQDRLDYYREAVETGTKDPETLWREVEQLQEAEHRYRQTMAQLNARREAVARHFGGNQWRKLQDWLVVIAS